jgi:hypothetical protein
VLGLVLFLAVRATRAPRAPAASLRA